MQAKATGNRRKSQRDPGDAAILPPDAHNRIFDPMPPSVFAIGDIFAIGVIEPNDTIERGNFEIIFAMRFLNRHS